jgi:hypothetical protein
MRLTLNLPDGLVENLMAATGLKTKTAVIVSALQAYERQIRTGKLQALRGQAGMLRPTGDTRRGET